ncbi:MAG TPA: glycosyltransferase [Cyclobacteriaceae bacterium]|nr:glycosyltransferase [Cyclobacteriaceae bacterium]
MTTESKQPLVSIICVCYNHERFVKDALLSAVNNTYKNKEIIVVDDHSSDKSVEIIKEFIKDHPGIGFIQMPANKGNCAAFNAGFRKSKGDFLIDFAADDILPADCLQNSIDAFRARDSSYGVLYGDVLYITEDGRHLHKHSEKFPPAAMPEGDIYIDLIKKYFVSSASMTIRRSVLEKLNGYDESLAYEDFDFWIRSSREFKYFYSNTVQIFKRMVKGSMSDTQFERGNPQQLTTYRVCEKILDLNRTTEEDEALSQRIKYELKKSLLRFDFSLARKYRELQKDLLNKVSRAAYK